MADDYSDDHTDDQTDDEFLDDDAEFAAEGKGPIRLQKVLAAAGLGSRRACEDLIVDGRVEIDGRIVTELGTRVDPETAIIRVDGSRLPTRSGMTYLVLNKPRGVVSTMSDPEGRPCVGDYVQDRKERLFHVGRLDTDTEGLILLTNDGELANRLSHPRYGVSKIYFADVPGPLPRDLSRTLKSGVELEDGIARADKFRQIGFAGGRAQVEVEIHEGRNHIVRRMLEAVGHPVSRLVRVQVGPVNMGNLAPGRMRHLTTHEVSALLSASESDAPRPRKAPAAKRGGKRVDPAKKNVGAPSVRKAAAAKKAAAKPTEKSTAPGRRSAAQRAAEKQAPGRSTTAKQSAGRSADARTPGRPAAKQEPGRSADTRGPARSPGKPASGKPSSGKQSSGKQSFGKATSQRSASPTGGAAKPVAKSAGAKRTPQRMSSAAAGAVRKGTVAKKSSGKASGKAPGRRPAPGSGRSRG